MRQPVTRVWAARDRVYVALEMVSVAGREEDGVKDAVECLRRLGRVWGAGEGDG